MSGWHDLAAELACWQSAGRPATLWWRDDDATTPTPALARLLELASRHDVPLALAVIPDAATPALAAAVDELPWVTLLQHGCRHRNHAPAGEKKAEFGPHRPLPALLADLGAGQARLAELFGARPLPVFVPPWNRIAEQLVAALPPAGVRGLSRYRPRVAARPVAGLVEANCHVDPIDWRGDRGFAGEAAVLTALVDHLRARRHGEVDAGEPTGLLTHHADCDGDGWRFLEKLLDFLAKQDACYWLSGADVFRLDA